MTSVRRLRSGWNLIGLRARQREPRMCDGGWLAGCGVCNHARQLRVEGRPTGYQLESPTSTSPDTSMVRPCCGISISIRVTAPGIVSALREPPSAAQVVEHNQGETRQKTNWNPIRTDSDTHRPYTLPTI